MLQKMLKNPDKAAARVHNTLTDIIVDIARRTGEKNVLLTGGCFQNKVLLESAVKKLTQSGKRPFWHHRLPPNDGGITPDSAHVLGTLRMGTDPATSVADVDGRAHDVPNLFLPWSGLFVTSAGVNPTGTIWALAYRTAEAITRDHGHHTAQNVAPAGARREHSHA